MIYGLRVLAHSASVLALALAPSSVSAQSREEAQLNAIIDEGLSHSQAMATASELMDGIGPRLTNTDNYDRAAAWAQQEMRDLGLTGVGTESYEFGVGWDLRSYSAAMVEPRPLQMTAIPVAWSPGTNGVIRGPVVVAPMSKPEHFAEWRGKLAGKIVLVSMPGTTSESQTPRFRRFESKDIAERNEYDLPSDPDEDAIERRLERVEFPVELSRFLQQEGALAMVKRSYRDNKLVHGEGYSFAPGGTLALPYMELSAEDYRRLVRLSIAGPAPVIDLAIDADLDTADTQAENIFGEIAGSDPKAGYVMAGAHFDSWIAADGATDNGAGSIVVLEAARILKSLGVKPKRTIRFALWSGEEQGLLGSIAYIDEHLASRSTDPSLSGMKKYVAWREGFPISKKPGYDQLKAYFNLDNGGGRIRGIYAENNVGAMPMLRKWLSPFASMDADNVVASRTGGTDHQFMQSVGLPAFQFVQDPLDYSSTTHHSSADTLDHLRADDLRQAATIMAAMLWQAANSEEVLPRPPLPTEPSKSDPFVVQDPDD